MSENFIIFMIDEMSADETQYNVNEIIFMLNFKGYDKYKGFMSLKVCKKGQKRQVLNSLASGLRQMLHIHRQVYFMAIKDKNNKIYHSDDIVRFTKNTVLKVE
ncbi:hypothetical protein KDD93_03330 [Campylobacter sp. faydin G-24]|uniref:Uncharacterized protein n=2 Tax=Campylobacter anatolicus TaxID=2829105 RepID=A0ABS5HH54_9BACT|nr:hypothetical protein [Campylobacter anatolicus]MBR8463604.1 hypothetical protein [Campylobacter anatolicus]MBR8465040.1 hypothetical protein [Campylobacter anatolicus]